MDSAESAGSTSPSLPRIIGPYVLFDRIGRGGMAEIFLARSRTDLGATRLLVVKQILPQLAESPEFSDLLISEAKLAARLNHGNVVQVHDLGRSDGFLYIAMQYVEGFDLAELLRRCAKTKTPLPVQYALLVIIEALRGLDYAHRSVADDGRPLGLVHRDVSPSNLLISFEGEVKLCDFGIARASDVTGEVPDEVVRGKAGYMSPEHARGEPVDARSDVFAIGIVLWELLAGRKLYRIRAEGPSLLDQARAAQVPELSPLGLADEDKLFGIVRRALDPVRTERYPSAGAMLRDLEAYVARAKLVASPLRFGDWLMEHFGAEIIEQRRARERAAQAIESGLPRLPASMPTPRVPRKTPSMNPRALDRLAAEALSPLPIVPRARPTPADSARPSSVAPRPSSIAPRPSNPPRPAISSRPPMASPIPPPTEVATPLEVDVSLETPLSPVAAVPVEPIPRAGPAAPSAPLAAPSVPPAPRRWSGVYLAFAAALALAGAAYFFSSAHVH